jgi:hypothetical protein
MPNPSAEGPDDHVSAIKLKDGLWHGAYWVNRPTPSGCVRYVLQTTHNEGHATPEAAAEQMHNIYPQAAYAEASR